MAEQYKNKHLASDAVDGRVLKIKKNQSVRAAKQDGSEVDLIKLGASDEVLLKGQEVASKASLDAEALARQSGDAATLSGANSYSDSLIEAEVLARDAAISVAVIAEREARELFDGMFDANLNQEISDRQAADQALSEQITSTASSLMGTIGAVYSDLMTEVSAREAGDAATLVSANSYTDSAVADLVNSSPAALDTLKELSDALGSDPNFATTVSTQIGTISSGLASEASTRAAADSALQSSVSSLSSSVTSVQSSVTSLQSSVTTIQTNVTSLQAADVTLGGRLDSLETINGFIRGSLYNDTLGVYGSAQQGVEDPSQLTRDGWYYQNTVAGQSISWYYHDGVSYPTTKAQLKNTFAVMTFDDKTAKPIFGVYSMPTGSNDIMPGFAHSKWVFQVPTASMNSVVLGKKYLVYAGDVAPTIHPELPRLQATYVAASSGGQMLSSEYISTISLISDGAVAVNKVKWLVESVGIHSDAFKYEGKLVIRHATKAALDAEISARTSADSSLSSSLTSLTTRVSSAESSITSLTSSVSGKASSSYVDTQDAAKLVEAKAYTDTKIAAIPPVDLSGYYTKTQVDSSVASEASAREAADAVLQAAIDSKTIAFGKSSKVLASSASSVTLDHKANHDSLIVFLDCQPLHLGKHFTANSSGAATVLTFIGDVAPGEIQAVEEGETIHATYAKA